jgi:ribonucleoside-triphosphate reductase
VCTINLPRAAFKADKTTLQGDIAERTEVFLTEVVHLVNTAGRVNHTKRKIVERRIANGNLPLYTLGFMDLKRQYSTVGVNGLNEALEILGYDIMTPEGQAFVVRILEIINAENDKLQKKYKAPHNCEQIPGENVSIKLAEKDRLLKYNDRYKIYSNQFIPLTTKADLLDRIHLQGLFDGHFSGGAIMHAIVEQRITDPQRIVDLIKYCARNGVVYWAINYNLQRCSDGHMSVGKGDSCAVCGATVVDNFTRVVGFLTSVRNWHKVRREVDYPERQFYGTV